MRSRDVWATTAGLLFIAATATSLIGTAFLGSLLKGPNFLAAVALHQNRLLVAALFQLLAAFTSAAIAVALYPVLRRYAAAMVLGAVAFRLIEGVFFALSAVGTLILVSMSCQLTAARTPHRSTFGRPTAAHDNHRPWLAECVTHDHLTCLRSRRSPGRIRKASGGLVRVG